MSAVALPLIPGKLYRVLCSIDGKRITLFVIAINACDAIGIVVNHFTKGAAA